MGNSESQPVDDSGLKPGSDEWWWREAEKNLAPVKSCEEFCTRFHAKKKDYEENVELFNKLLREGPCKDLDYFTHDGWLATFPENLRKWIDIIWRGFDHNSDGKLTLEEWLVYEGILKYGTLEQHLMGSFMMFDIDGDHRITGEEFCTLMRALFELHGEELPEEGYDDIKRFVFERADADHSGTLELGEAIDASRKNQKIASLLNFVSP